MVAILATRRGSFLLDLVVGRRDRVGICEPEGLGLLTFQFLLALLPTYLRGIAGIRASHTSSARTETSPCSGEDEQFHRCSDPTSDERCTSVLCVDNLHVSARGSEANLHRRDRYSVPVRVFSYRHGERRHRGRHVLADLLGWYVETVAA